MVFAKLKFTDGHTESVFCDDATFRWHTLHGAKAMFSLPFCVRGANYRDRQDWLYNLAVDFQCNNDGETDFQLSYGEMGEICDFFERMGKRYGLLREFRENCIC